MSVLANLVVQMSANTSALEKGLKRVESKAGGLGNTFKKVGTIAAGFLAAKAVTSGIQKMTGFLSDCTAKAKEQALVEAQLDAVLKSTGGAAGMTADEVKKLASELQKTTNYGDEATIAAQNMLLTFTNIGKDVFPATTKVVQDMATAMGTDLTQTAIQVGKALQDPVQGVTALQRVGVRLTEQQKEQVKAMMDVGDVAGAQKLILAELNKEFGGSAEAAVAADHGMQQMENRMGDLQERIGTKLLPIMAKWKEIQLAILNVLVTKLGPAIGQVSKVISEKILPVLKEWWQKHGPKITEFVQDTVSALKSFLAPALDTLADLWENLQPPLKAVWELIESKVLPVLKKVGEFLMDHKPLLIAIAAVILTLVSPWLAVAAAIVIVLAKWDAISQFFSKDVPATIDAFLDKIGEIPIIGEIFKGAFEAIKIVVETTFGIIKNQVETAINAIRDIIKIVTALIHGDWEEAWGGVKDLVTGIWDGIKEHIDLVLGGIKDLIGVYMGTFLGVIKDGWKLISDFFTKTVPNLFWGYLDLWKTIWIDIPKKLFEAAFSKLQSAWDSWLKPFFTKTIPDLFWGYVGIWKAIWWDIPRKLLSKADGLLGGFMSAIAGVSGDLKQKGTDILKWVWQGLNKIYGMGKDLVEELWDGIQAMAGWFMDKIGGFIGDIMGKLDPRGWFGSPGLVEYGKMIPALLLEGMKAGKESLLVELGKLGRESTVAFVESIKAAKTTVEQAGLDLIKAFTRKATEQGEKEGKTSGEKTARALTGGLASEGALQSLPTAQYVSTALADAIVSLQDWFVASGRGIAGFLMSGIYRGFLYDFASYAKDIADIIYEALKDALGAASPAKKLIPLGKMAAEGYAQGWQQASKGRMALTPALATAGGVTVTTAPLVSPSGVGGGTTIINNNYTTKFDGPLLGDQRQLEELADALMPIVRQRMG